MDVPIDSGLPHHGYPDRDQWIALIRADPQRARQLLRDLCRRRDQQGLAADAVVQLSIEDYLAAEVYLASHPPEEQRQAPAAPSLALPESSLYDPYPDEQGWRRLLEQDMGAARRLLGTMLVQRARMGPLTPPTLEVSIDVGNQVWREYEAEAGKGRPPGEPPV